MPPISGDDGQSGLPVPEPGTFGVRGDSRAGFGVVGTSSGKAGVYGNDNSVAGVGIAVGSGVLGTSTVGTGVAGTSLKGAGTFGHSDQGPGVFGASNVHIGVHGQSETSFGVNAFSAKWIGIRTIGARAGLHSRLIGSSSEAFLATTTSAGGTNAATFIGDVSIIGRLSMSQAVSLIDHPLDPANKTLQHSSVESSDRKNVYDGIAVLNGKGEAVVKLPAWFSALNGDFRYQLTCIGAHAPVFVAQEIANNRFRIAGGSPDLKVSWQVTGIRQDPWAKANPLAVEETKPKEERGTFFYPELYGQPEEKSLRQARYPQIPELPLPLNDLGREER